MTFYPFVLAAIFILHNFEEWYFFDRLPKLGPFKRFANRNSFLFAISLLTVLVIVCSFPYFQKTHLIILLSLMINAIQHGVISIWYRRIIPGTFSALLLMLPFSTIYLIKLFSGTGLGLKMFIYNLFLSLIAMGIAIWTTLWLGNFIFSNKRN